MVPVYTGITMALPSSPELTAAPEMDSRLRGNDGLGAPSVYFMVTTEGGSWKGGCRGDHMRIEYDAEVDALYVQFKDVRPDDNVDVEEGVTVDLDDEGHIVGLEILDAAERLGLESLMNISIENMPLEGVAAK